MFLTKESPTVKRRSKGEQTRLLILQSATEVLAKNGIKGTTHRAIANNANIQLSLTTYYFKDIQELVHQAFTLCSSQITAKTSLAWQPAIDLLSGINKTTLRKLSEKENLREKLSEMITQQLVKSIINSPVELTVQQLLFSEVQVSPQLHALAEMHRETLLAQFIRLCEFFNVRDAQIDADIMLTVFTQLQYRNVAIPSETLAFQNIHATVTRVIGNIMNLKG
ncbi:MULTISPECIES: TetR/AcrR family transcriptional regulator [unclassified Colwellia]|uniref:TetR/AcrR family transcriptional regulator n=1 Tax=unclassified Colwellia TaxID=196834 RepID=UPI0015F74544|nr:MULTISPECIES: TetR family transcriptional regulator [unclassified Colwellia]MBA6304271.1 TetR family transcriptional regulator [Colwellia sp. MB02u-14]MBA6234160.1 TetR family transcriptional regulator [Colwellia sp. MB02u-7]MBA6237918.1 TetR family transcriptional regulator [Colwellia sp. MB02u-11]MBA6259526.1 TetR family transcriptional regulator [Colwellia sp. MB3u-41]MBA6300834.1 TetR family transcriptional regulator [Colwellia sp. MB3u-22]